MRVNKIGQGLLAAAISDLFLFIKSSAFNEQLEEILKTVGVKPELDILQAVVDDFAICRESRAIKVASVQIKEPIDKILTQLKAIQAEFEYHKTRYFNEWRSPVVESFMSELKELKSLLSERRELLVSMLNVQRIPPPQPRKTILERLLD